MFQHLQINVTHDTNTVKDRIIGSSQYTQNKGFPGGLVVNNPSANGGDIGPIPALGISYMMRSN